MKNTLLALVAVSVISAPFTVLADDDFMNDGIILAQDDEFAGEEMPSDSTGGDMPPSEEMPAEEPVEDFEIGE
ncbi:MAG: hypothetical protein JNM93_01475 [Bacteriovoracaceae bacterium]|nr:hypothetical protein [Bacteriovoracaceae bacterium]